MKKSVLIIIGFFVLLFLVLALFSAKITGNTILSDYPTSFSFEELMKNEMINFAVVFIFAYIAFYLLIYKTIFRNSKGLAIITSLIIAVLASFGILNAFGPVLSYLNTPTGTAIVIIALVLAIIGVIRWNTKNRAPVIKGLIFGYPIGYLIYSSLTSQQFKASLGVLHKILTFLFYPMLLIAIFTLLVTLFKRRQEKMRGRGPSYGGSRKDRRRQEKAAKKAAKLGGGRGRGLSEEFYKRYKAEQEVRKKIAYEDKYTRVINNIETRLLQDKHMLNELNAHKKQYKKKGGSVWRDYKRRRNMLIRGINKYQKKLSKMQKGG